VLIAALISGAGAPRVLLQRWLRGDFELVVSPKLLAELERVLSRPKFGPYVTEPEGRAYVALLRRLATIVPDPPLIAELTPDPGDDYLVVLARASGAPFHPRRPAPIPRRTDERRKRPGCAFSGPRLSAGRLDRLAHLAATPRHRIRLRSCSKADEP
jgi:hypothetical protein